MSFEDRLPEHIGTRLGVIFRNAVPGILMLSLVFVAVIPVPLPAYSTVVPMIPFMALYYWAVHRPDLLPFPMVFVLGILQDVLTGAPLGVNAFIFMIALLVVSSQRRFLVGRSFWVLWWGFLIVLPLTAVMEWVLYSAIFGAVMPVEPAIFRALMTMGAFPALAWICMQCHRLVPQ
ncbi:rod shape-determining protein MreD [Fodinicurvata sp. EGI_FJ10296]|uniref:rod shape-determining protein MreD n=1 Tax=Fodinicurvata sp. EGI_FJ10296 TaxID=3231908 RepID=UPI0034530D88